MLKPVCSLLLALFCVLAVAVSGAFAQPFTLPALPYASDALEPYIDKMTMEIHHGMHHQAYVNNLNAQVKNFPELEGMSLESMMARISTFNAAVRNNGGGHYNHDLFWKLMAPPGQGGEPSAALMQAITEGFGSLDELKKQFNQAAATRFGSGWAWVIVTGEKKLAVTSTANQDNPLMDVVEVKGTPILGVDVWEHAYYLSYQNRRGAYLDFWWNLVNWNEVNRRFAEALR
ncbi:superoxide dismutase [Geoalkalibacter sp.]|uniref:superoxide dismutase n=1 Tax=Geoalkalibacter sp. TaxID=3041440 RepID=UPI00272E10FF|nr:superoxide dismutase [Geoalkalibacter sp.]